LIAIGDGTTKSAMRVANWSTPPVVSKTENDPSEPKAVAVDVQYGLLNHPCPDRKINVAIL
jgi:hypothetical protein